MTWTTNQWSVFRWITRRIFLSTLYHLEFSKCAPSTPAVNLKQLTLETGTKILLKMRLWLKFVKPRTMVAQMVRHGSVYCTKHNHNHCKTLLHFLAGHCFQQTMAMKCHEQFDSFFWSLAHRHAKTTRKQKHQQPNILNSHIRTILLLWLWPSNHNNRGWQQNCIEHFIVSLRHANRTFLIFGNVMQNKRNQRTRTQITLRKCKERLPESNVHVECGV